MDLIPQNERQMSLWQDLDDDIKHQGVMKSVDHINRNMGRDTVRFATQGFGRKWKLRQEQLSQRYTTCWEELLEVRC